MSTCDQVFRKCIQLQIPATEFEVVFLMASIYFHAECCDAVVLEVVIVR